MSLSQQILFGIALAMDCFSASITTGLLLRRFQPFPILTMALLFGLFQALMPFIGWLAVMSFGSYIQSVDHWIAFALLTFIGVKMIIDQFKEEGQKTINPHKASVILLLAFATSIDALAVGISFQCMGMHNWSDIASPILVIGLTSTIFSLTGNIIGITVGKRFRFPAELVGGIILIVIGIKVLVEHLA